MRCSLLIFVSVTLALHGVACDSGGPDETGPSTDETGADETGVDTGIDETGADETGAAEAGADTAVDETGADETVVDGTGDTGVDTGVDETGADPAPVCTQNGYTVSGSTSSIDADGAVVWSGTDSPGKSFNRLRIELPGGSSLLPGDYPLEEPLDGDCTVCASLGLGCSADGAQDIVCEETMTAISGTVTLTAVPSPPIPNTVPLEMLGNFPIAAEPAQETCVPEGTGTYIGHNIADYPLQNCLGDTVRLHDSCGEVEAVVLMSVATWCTACTYHLEVLQEQIGGTITTESTRTVYPKTDFRIILFEDAYGNQPTVQTCMQYAQSHNIDPAMVLLDWGGPLRGTLQGAAFAGEDPEVGWCVEEVAFEGTVSVPTAPPITPMPWGGLGQGMATTWTHLNPYVSSYSGQATPWYAILDGDNMEYRWNSFKEPFGWFNDKLFSIIYE